MADTKVSGYSECTDPTHNDELYIVDVSESTDADKSKKVLFNTLISRIVCVDDAVVCVDNEVVII